MFGYHRRIYQKAAALLHSLALNHGFVDANKRTTLLVVNLFLEKSGYEIVSPANIEINDELETLVLGVVEHQIDFEALADWFRLRLGKIGRASSRS